MGIFSGVADFLGLTPDLSGAMAAAQFNPYNIQTSYGGVNYDPTTRTFSTQFDPALKGARQGFAAELGAISPERTLSLFRQQALPYNQAQLQAAENRLFSQGRLDHSQVYQPGGFMRGLFDAQLQQDLGFQLAAAQEADRRRGALLQQIGGITGMEQGLFNPAMGFGQIGMQGQAAAAGLAGQEAMATSNIIGSVLGGATLGLFM